MEDTIKYKLKQDHRAPLYKYNINTNKSPCNIISYMIKDRHS